MSAASPIAILGLGLIGGSLARDLSEDGATVWGYDADTAATRHAHRAGVIAHVIEPSLRSLRDARTVILAVPVDAATELLQRAAPYARRATLVTDVGSTKLRIMQQAQALGLASRFVGSHPMAGSHESGWLASRRGLFAGKRVHLCRSAKTSAAAWRAAGALWQRVGAQATEHDAARHDAEVAFSSHLPQLLAVALAGTLQARGFPRDRLGAGGRDMTRMAASSVDMWAPILTENSVPVLDALETCLAQLGALRGAVARGDRAAISEAFAAVREWRGTEI